MRTSTSARRLLGIEAVTALVSALLASAALAAHAEEDEARSFTDCLSWSKVMRASASSVSSAI